MNIAVDNEENTCYDDTKLHYSANPTNIRMKYEHQEKTSMAHLVMVNPSLAPLVETRTPIRPIPLGVITCPRTTAARLKCKIFSRRTTIMLLG